MVHPEQPQCLYSARWPLGTLSPIWRSYRVPVQLLQDSGEIPLKLVTMTPEYPRVLVCSHSLAQHQQCELSIWPQDEFSESRCLAKLIGHLNRKWPSAFHFYDRRQFPAASAGYSSQLLGGCSLFIGALPAHLSSSSKCNQPRLCFRQSLRSLDASC